MKVEFSRHVFEKCSDIKFNENPSSGSRVVQCGQEDGQTVMTKRIVAFHNFANAAKKSIGSSSFHLSRDNSFSCNMCQQSSVRIVCLTQCCLLFTALLNCEKVILCYVGLFVFLCGSSCDFCCIGVVPVLHLTIVLLHKHVNK